MLNIIPTFPSLLEVILNKLSSANIDCAEGVIWMHGPGCNAVRLTLDYHNKSVDNILSQQDNNPKHISKKVQKKIMDLWSSGGLHSPQTLTQLNMFGIISKGSWKSLKNLKTVLVNSRTGYKGCGRKF